ncbi:MAG: DNA polymerase III subunit beta [Gammaproteobacteria bacterium]|nr:MAG: DNA polymerase III subunit beta [Gammaproteobacteria bacterium]
MKFCISKEPLFTSLSSVCGVIERRQTLPVLSNLLFTLTLEKLIITGTDLEVELVSSVIEDLEVSEAGDTTLPARKLLDICKNLPDNAKITFSIKNDKATVTSGKSRFSLSTLPAEDFPSLEQISPDTKVNITKGDLKTLFDSTSFAMALQDVRYYLNGLLFEVSPSKIRTVATDGHRLAISDMDKSSGVTAEHQVIIPRKGVIELQRLLDDSDEGISLELSSNHIQVVIGSIRFTSKLIDGKFPDYERVIPVIGDRIVSIDKEILKKALTRAAILSNEKYRGVRFTLTENNLSIQAHNPEQEEAQEEIMINFNQAEFEVGFNVNYLLDAIGCVGEDVVELGFADANSSCLISGSEERNNRYVVMPMRL